MSNKFWNVAPKISQGNYSFLRPLSPDVANNSCRYRCRCCGAKDCLGYLLCLITKSKVWQTHSCLGLRKWYPSYSSLSISAAENFRLFIAYHKSSWRMRELYRFMGGEGWLDWTKIDLSQRRQVCVCFFRARLGYYAYVVWAVVLFAVHCNLFASLGLILRLWRLNVAELYANSLEQRHRHKWRK